MHRKKSEIKRQWHLVDARGKILGRLASQIAILLQGKNKPGFLPYLDQGDWVVVVNAREIKVTGRKPEQKIYYHYTGYPGGIKAKKFREVFSENPAWVLKKAVKGMLPRNKLRKDMLKRLKIFVDGKHPYESKFQIPNPKSKIIPNNQNSKSKTF